MVQTVVEAVVNSDKTNTLHMGIGYLISSYGS